MYLDYVKLLFKNTSGTENEFSHGPEYGHWSHLWFGSSSAQLVWKQFRQLRELAGDMPISIPRVLLAYLSPTAKTELALWFGYSSSQLWFEVNPVCLGTHPQTWQGPYRDPVRATLSLHLVRSMPSVDPAVEPKAEACLSTSHIHHGSKSSSPIQGSERIHTCPKPCRQSQHQISLQSHQQQHDLAQIPYNYNPTKL